MTREWTGFAREHDESRYRADLGFGPEFVWHLRTRTAMKVATRLALPVGVTWLRIHPGEIGPVADTYSRGFGWQFATLAGLDADWGNGGIYGEWAILGQFTQLSHQAALESDPSVQARDEYHYAQWGLSFSVGYLFQF